MLTQNRLKQVLLYDEISGEFTWKNAFRKRAGCLNKGYVEIQVDGKSYGAHRLAWLYVYGEFPSKIDHKDRNPCNNSIFNLRIATTSQNAYNMEVKLRNRLGVRGITKTPYGKYQATFTFQRKQVYVGTFETIDEAREAFLNKIREYYGEFSCNI